MRLIDRLKAKYPDKGFQMDPITGVISFEHDGFDITDPFVTECGRFAADPNAYGIDINDEVAIFGHNMPLGATYSNGGVR